LRPSIPATREIAYAPQFPSGGALTQLLYMRAASERIFGAGHGSWAGMLCNCREATVSCVAAPSVDTFEVPAMSLTEARFHDLVDATQEKLEDIFDESDLDLDLESSAGVLTVKFENGTQFIFSRQEPLRQLWLAAVAGGFHFDYDEEEKRWVCDKSEELLGEMLHRLALKQAGVEIEFDAVDGHSDGNR
jgi:CyaY protein